MSLEMEQNCIFCKIAKSEVPCYKIYEDNKYLAFLDIRPYTEGHTMVIPKEHYQWVWDVPAIGEYMRVCQKVAKHYQKVSGREMVFSLIIGEGVPHAHIHIVPDEEGNFKKKLSGLNEGLSEKHFTKSDWERIVLKYRLMRF